MLCSAFWLSWLAAGSQQNTKLSSNQDQAQRQAQSQTKTNEHKDLDPCSLLSGNDIAAILGEPLQELKPSVQATRNMNMSQCLFVTRNFAKSASLLVAMPGSEDSGARNLRALWRNQFHSPRKQEEERRPASIKSPAKSAFTSPREAPEPKAVPNSESDRESDNEAEDDARKPRPISALGEEAYWVGSPLAGALYVLQGDLFLRISVGGIPKESTRIAKSKSLAAAILPRLRRNPPR
jgi:hypothetical protein